MIDHYETRRLPKIDLAGHRYGRLTVTEKFERVGNRGYRWVCGCDCGATTSVFANKLRSGATTSCGCYRLEKTKERSTTHGMSRSDEYRIYKGMINRCYLRTSSAYRHYGGRGISVCDRWLHGEEGKEGFLCFLEDMGPRPSKSYSLERRDNHGDYYADNVKWATAQEQANNSRQNRLLQIVGHLMPMSEAHRAFPRVSYATIQKRLRKGWDDESAVLCMPGYGPLVDLPIPF